MRSSFEFFVEAGAQGLRMMLVRRWRHDESSRVDPPRRRVAYMSFIFSESPVHYMTEIGISYMRLRLRWTNPVIAAAEPPSQPERISSHQL